MSGGCSIPEISVLMPVYNGEKFLSKSIESITSQSFKNFEFIIVNDGSTDSTSKILKFYSQQDSRITIVNNVCNLGISAALNKGLAVVKSPLVARMDADDVAMMRRLEIQYKFMEDNPEIIVCGSYVGIIDSSEVWTVPTCNMAIRAKLLFWNSLYHPTVMFRKSAITTVVSGYNESLSGVEDYALWIDLAEDDKIIFANIPEVLVNYRLVLTTPYRKNSQKKRMLKELYARQLKSLGIIANSGIIHRHWRCIHGQSNVTLGQFHRNCSWLMYLLAANYKSKKYSMDFFASEVVCWQKRFKICSSYKVILSVAYRVLRLFRDSCRVFRPPV